MGLPSKRGRQWTRRGSVTTVHLAGLPGHGVGPEGDPPCARIDVLARHHGGGDLVEPPLTVDLAAEVLGVLLALGVPVAGSPVPVRALGDAGHVILRTKASGEAAR